jgi:LAS superfamily LD-carboxypeptidase LdcB
MLQPDKNPRGEYAMWENGHFMGYMPLARYQTILLHPEDVAGVDTMVQAAEKDGVILTAAVGYRSITIQILRRRENVFDKAAFNKLTPEFQETFIMNASSSLFHPETGKPGYSKHQKAKAIDWNVTDPHDKTKTLPSYAWLCKNAYGHGFIRTIPSERWHFEPANGRAQFQLVSRDHPSWDGLV